MIEDSVCVGECVCVCGRGVNSGCVWANPDWEHGVKRAVTVLPLLFCEGNALSSMLVEQRWGWQGGSPLAEASHGIQVWPSHLPVC